MMTYCEMRSIIQPLAHLNHEMLCCQMPISMQSLWLKMCVVSFVQWFDSEINYGNSFAMENFLEKRQSSL